MLFAANNKLVHQHKVGLRRGKRGDYYKLIQIGHGRANKYIAPREYLTDRAAFAVLNVFNPIAHHGRYAVLSEPSARAAYYFRAVIAKHGIEAAYAL